jgi:cyclohexa-1,5-dienecarbonyl-CoA hydratase
VKLIAIEGQGSDFSFGASIAEHLPEPIATVLPEAHALLREILRAPAATAAIVRGRCLGGGFELALACDFIFAATDAVLGLPEIALGAFPPAGAALRPLRVGASRAAEAVLTGAPLTAAAWRSRGLIALTATPSDLDAEVDRWFDAYLAPRSAVAIRHAADAARRTLRTLAESAIAESERVYLDDLIRTHDAVEGVKAFLEKRPPKWTDG